MEIQGWLCYGNCTGCETEFEYDIFYCSRCSFLKGDIRPPTPITFIMFKQHAKYRINSFKKIK